MPVCIGCDDDLPADNFNQKQSRCRPCEKKYKAENYLKNKAIIQAKQKEYREENAEKLKASKKEYRDNNKDKEALRKKNYKIANRSKENLRKKAFARKKYEPTRWLTAHKSKYSHVLKEILLELNFKACPGCKKRYNMRHFQHKKTGNETTSCQTCRDTRNSSSQALLALERQRDLYENVLAPYAQSVKKEGKCVDCSEDNYLLLEFDHVDPATKKCLVLRCKSLRLMKEEIDKCVLRCCLCHLIKTQKDILAKGVRKETEKDIFLLNHKLEKGSCEACKRTISRDTTSHFDLDHLDRKTKTDELSKMVKQSKYSIEDIQKELKNTRMLCRNCHRLHTLMQLFGTGGGLAGDIYTAPVRARPV